MSKRALINLLLLTLVAALAAFLYFVPREEPPAPPVISTIAADSIDQISINRSGQTELRFSRLADGWQMLAPLTAPALPNRIKAILDLLHARSHAQYDPAELDLDSSGLRSPAVILKLNGYEFRFGNATALADGRYLLFQNQVYLINDGLYQQLQQPPEFFVQRSKE